MKEKKDKSVLFRMTSEQFELLQKMADEMGNSLGIDITISDVIRRKLFFEKTDKNKK